MLLRCVSWKEYVLVRDLLDGPGLRMTYVEGVLELMSPSREHELWKTNTARLLELFAHKKGIELYGYGSMTFKNKARERGAEPDECYVIGKTLAEYPELVIEVVHTTPLIDKLDVYSAFGIAEVWVFRNNAFTRVRARSRSGAIRDASVECARTWAESRDGRSVRRARRHATGATGVRR